MFGISNVLNCKHRKSLIMEEVNNEKKDNSSFNVGMYDC